MDPGGPERAGFRPRLAINLQPGAKCGQDRAARPPAESARRGWCETEGRPAPPRVHADRGGAWQRRRRRPRPRRAGGRQQPAGGRQQPAGGRHRRGVRGGRPGSGRPGGHSSGANQAGYVHASRPPPEPSAKRGHCPRSNGHVFVPASRSIVSRARSVDRIRLTRRRHSPPAGGGARRKAGRPLRVCSSTDKERHCGGLGAQPNHQAGQGRSSDLHTCSQRAGCD